VSGLVTVDVVSTELPLLLPLGFCRHLGMILNTSADTATWQLLGNKISEVITLASSHIAIDVSEFPPEGWKNPHQSHGNGFVQEKNPTVAQAEFECTTTRAPVSADLLKTSDPLDTASAFQLPLLLLSGSAVTSA
jgi:hypothetical protein